MSRYAPWPLAACLTLSLWACGEPGDGQASGDPSASPSGDKAAGDESASGSRADSEADLAAARVAFDRGKRAVQEHLAAPDHELLREAIAALEESVRLAPNEVDHRLWAGRTHELLLNSSAALAHYRIATGLGHNDPLIWRRMGNLALGLGEMELARRAFERAIAQDPQDHELYFGYGCLLDLEDDLETARAAFERAIAIRPTYDDAFLRLAGVLRGLGEDAAADASQAQFEYWNVINQSLDDALKHVRMHPKDSQALIAVGLYMYELQRPKESVDWLQKGLAVQPEHVRAVETLGRAHHKLGNLSKAQEYLQKAIGLQEDKADALVELSFVYADGAANGRALETMEAALQLAPNRADLHFQHGVLLMQLNSPDRALAAYENALANDPDLIDAHLGVAEVYYMKGNHKEACAAYARVLAIDPGNVPATRSLAFIEGNSQ